MVKGQATTEERPGASSLSRGMVTLRCESCVRTLHKRQEEHLGQVRGGDRGKTGTRPGRRLVQKEEQKCHRAAMGRET